MAAGPHEPGKGSPIIGIDRAEQAPPPQVAWAINPATRLVRVAPVSRIIGGSPPLFLPFALIKQMASALMEMEAAAELQGLPFPRFELQQAGQANPFDDNGVRRG
jgi:hypothetical protein